MDRPPCWPDGHPCPNRCAHELHERIAHNLTPLHGPWTGWRMAGRVLVSPDGDRIAPERLRGLMFREALQKRRRAGLQGGGVVVTLPPRERFHGQA